MKDRINRRDFIRQSAATGAALGLGANSVRGAVFNYDRANTPAEKINIGFIITFDFTITFYFRM